jgi:hypothetical protein
MSRLEPTPAARRRDRVVGLIIIGLAFLGCLGLSLFAKHLSTPRPAPDPAPPSTARLPGFPGAVRPFELVKRAHEVTVRSLFVGFDADGVRADGTMDFAQKGTKLRFAFQSPQGIGPQPPREGGTLPKRTYCGRQSVRVGKHGLVAEPDDAKVGCPRPEPEALPSPPPACGLEQVWALAKKRRIKDDGPARIEYFRADSGPAYRFVKEQKKGQAQRFVVSARDCREILKGRGQRGSVP